MEAATNGIACNDAVVEGDGSFRAKQEMATAMSSGQGGDGTMQTTTADSRPTRLLAEARRLMEAASTGMKGPRNDAVVQGDGSFRAKQEMATATSSGQGGYETMQTTTADSRPTAPGNSPGIGNKGEIIN
ncbi:hypothetical protein EJB05_48717, partial [Eragrostis curvula]